MVVVVGLNAIAADLGGERRCGGCDHLRGIDPARPKGPITVVVTPEGQLRHAIELVSLPAIEPHVSLGIAYAPGFENPWSDPSGRPILGAGWVWTLPCLVAAGAGGDAPASIVLIAGGIHRITFGLSGEPGSYYSHAAPTLRLSRTAGDAFVLREQTGGSVTFAGFSTAWPAPARGKPLRLETPYARGDRGVRFSYDAAGLLEGIGDSAGRRWRFAYVDGQVSGVSVERADGFALSDVSFLYGDPDAYPGLRCEVLRAVTWSLPGDLSRRAATAFHYHAQGLMAGLLAAILSPDAVARCGGVARALALDVSAANAVASVAVAFERWDGTPAVMVAGCRLNRCAACGSGHGGSYAITYARSASATGVNDWDRAVLQRNPEGACVVVEYNRHGQLLNHVALAAEGEKTHDALFSLRYDEAGRLVEVAYPAEGRSYDRRKREPVDAGGGLVRRFTYDALGRVTAEAVRAGDAGSDEAGWVTVREFAYEGSLPWPSETREYPEAGGPPVTTRARHEFLGEPALLRRVRTVEMLPPVAIEQNGSGAAAERVTTYDPDTGAAIAVVDPCGASTVTAYDRASGRMIARTVAAESVKLSTAWFHDPWGRLVEIEFPDGTREVTDRAFLADDRPVLLVYTEDAGGRRCGPVELAVEDAAGRTVCRARGVPAAGLAPREALDAAAYDLGPAWRGALAEREDFVYSGGVLARIERTLEPADQARSFVVKEFSYDAEGRVIRTVDAGGTIVRMQYDAFGRLVRTWEGLDPSERDLTLREKRSYAATGALEAVRVYEADPGLDEDTRGAVTTYTYDGRNRLVEIAHPEGGGVVRAHDVQVYDNLDHVIEVYRRPPGDTAARRVRSIDYDARGRVWRSTDWCRDEPANGRSTFFWYDEAGRLSKTLHPGGAYAKDVYDPAGRLVGRYVGFDPAEAAGGGREPHGEATGRSGLDDDVVLEAEEYIVDARGRTALQTHFIRRAGNEGLGPLAPGAGTRVRQAAAWYDAGGEIVDEVVVGPDRPAWAWRPRTPPPPSDDVVRTSVGYDEWGRPALVTHPDGRTVAYGYDALGRRVLEAENAAPPGETAEEVPCETVRTVVQYDAMDRPTLRRRETSGRDGLSVQETAYEYGVTLDGPRPSLIATGRLLRAIRHPDPLTGAAGTRPQDVEHFQYDARGLMVKRRWRAEGSGAALEHDYRYDELGRLAADSVAAAPPETDTAVRSVTYAYDAWGDLARITAHAGRWGTGAVRTQVALTRDGWGELRSTAEEHDGAVGPDTRRVTYAWDEGGDGGAPGRPAGITYVRGAGEEPAIRFSYGGKAAAAEPPWRRADAVLGRITSIAATFLPDRSVAEYAYEGLGQAVERRSLMAWPGFTLRRGVALDGLDRVTSVATDLTWGDRAVLRLDARDYRYDAAGRATLIVDRATPPGAADDTVRLYDSLGRLWTAARGEWSAPMLAGIRERHRVRLSGAGNWEVYEEGGRTETRDHNCRDEVTRIGADRAVAHDGRGNLVRALGTTLRYDAWNRVIAIETEDGADNAIERDGLGRPVRERHTGPAGTATTRDIYYRWPWSVATVIERSGDGTETREDYVGGIEEADDVIVMRRRAGARQAVYWFMADALGNVVGACDDRGLPVERYRYGPFGAATIEDGIVGRPRDESAIGNRLRFQGRWAYPNDLYDVRHRLYSARLGRFVQPDPTGHRHHHNLYAAPFGDSLRDPTGLKPELRDCERLEPDLVSFQLGAGIVVGGSISVAGEICDCCDPVKQEWIPSGWGSIGVRADASVSLGFAVSINALGFDFSISFLAATLRIASCEGTITYDGCEGATEGCITCGASLALGLTAFRISALIAGISASAKAEVGVWITACYGTRGWRGNLKFCYGYGGIVEARFLFFRRTWEIPGRRSCTEIAL
jgi:RHS repeat-associated protein